jgi:TonB family protein
MNSGLIWTNLITYSLQIGLLVGLAAFVPTLLRLRLPSAKLAYWHLLLVTCLLLPQLQPWKSEVVNGTIQVSTTIIAVQSASRASSLSVSWDRIGLAVLVAGVAGRLAWLALGFWKLRRYRLHSQALETNWLAGAGADLRICDDISSPVTFGLRHPVILVPARFAELDRPMQDAILFHEFLHVERHDWLFTLVEELIRSVFWFHPAIWWLLGEIQLAREQAVDRAVIERTQARDEYVDTLLAIAGARPEADLAPAPLFLRKRHLKQRVVSIFKEVGMSKTRLISALAAGLCIMAAACWFVTGTFPLAAAPQTDAPGVTVDLHGGTLMHRSPVAYPGDARQKGIEGSVTLDAVIDSNGNVNEVRVVSGPDELRKPAQQSVLQWHFTRDAAGSTRQVTINFQLPPSAAQPAQGGSTSIAVSPPSASLPQVRTIPPVGAAQAAGLNRPLAKIMVVGLSEQARTDLLSKLPVHEGDTITPELNQKTQQAVHEFDEHLTLTVARGINNGIEGIAYLISAPDTTTRTAVSTPAASALPASGDPSTIRVGGNVQAAKLIQQPRPVYPLDAKEARIQGVVKLQATIAVDGTVKNLEVLSGHPLLVPSALDAVRQWVYQTTLLNGNPVEVVTQIDVNFTLAQ